MLALPKLPEYEITAQSIIARKIATDIGAPDVETFIAGWLWGYADVKETYENIDISDTDGIMNLLASK